MTSPAGVNLTVSCSTEASQMMLLHSTPPEMKTGSGECVYCQAKVVHPRLGRGEFYACGYKPYRCEICNYSTVTKGNLAIHEQSDRHMNNIQEYDQQQRPQYAPESGEVGHTNSTSTDPHSAPAIQTPLLDNAAMIASSQAFFGSIKAFKHKGDICSVDDFSPVLLEVAERALLCQICNVFTTNDVEKLVVHAEQNRTPVNVDYINQQVTTHTMGAWHCCLCAYRSPLKANFQLHCKTEKHAQRLSLLLHMLEGRGGGGQGPSPPVTLHISPSPKTSVYCQLRCLPCDFFTCSIHKMRVHCQLPRHVFLAGVFGAVIRRRRQLRLSLMAASELGSGMAEGRIVYACRRCEFTDTSLMALMQHFHSTETHEPLGLDGYESEDVNVLWEQGGKSGAESHLALSADKSHLSQTKERREAESDLRGFSEPSASGRLATEKIRYKRTDSRRCNSLDNLEASPRLNTRSSEKEVEEEEEEMEVEEKEEEEEEEEESVQRYSAPPTKNTDFLFSFNQGTRKEHDSDNGADMSAATDDQMPHPLAAGAMCQTSNDGEGTHRGMHITTDPLSSWFNCANSQHFELPHGLAKLVGEQKHPTAAPRTCDSLFAWFNADNSFCSFIICWLKYQFPHMDGAISNEFVALILELIAQQPGVSGQFWGLRELQQRQAFSTCQQCSPPLSFLLPSSMSLHCNIHHNRSLPASIVEAIERMENTVIEIVLALQPQQSEASQIKRGRARPADNQTEILKSICRKSDSSDKEAFGEICEKAELRAKTPNCWLGEPQQSGDGPCVYETLQPPTNLSRPQEHLVEAPPLERTTKPPSSTKRFRTPISSIQQALLLQYFQADQNPSRRQMDVISSRVNLPKRVVQVWFQNARSRERRMFIKFAPNQPRSLKPPPLLSPTPSASWHSRQSSSQASPLNELESLVSSATPTSSALHSPSANKLQEIFSQIFAQMPPLGVPQPPVSATAPPVAPAATPHLPSQALENYELNSPLDLSTVSYRPSDRQSPASQTFHPQKSTVAETRSDNFCRRNRTSISSTQARFMLWFFRHHKTPTICECENIGLAIGLSRRVVQVWFQNQRAKEKKLARATTLCGESALLQSRGDSTKFLLEGDECKLCNVKIQRMSEEDTAAVTEHIFSKAHVDRLFATICQGDSWTGVGEKGEKYSSEPGHE